MDIHIIFSLLWLYSVTDRTGTSTGLFTDSFLSSPLPHSHVVYNYSHPIVTTCLHTSALLSAVLGSCLHPYSGLVMPAPARVSV